MYITDVTVKIEEFKRLCHVVVIMFANFKMFPTNFLSSTRIHKLFAILGILMIYNMIIVQSLTIAIIFELIYYTNGYLK